MKRIICRHNPKYYENAAWRIMDEVLTYIPGKYHNIALVIQDVKTLMRSGPGVYYVTDKLPKTVNIGCYQNHHYFCKCRVITKRKTIQNYIIPRYKWC